MRYMFARIVFGFLTLLFLVPAAFYIHSLTVTLADWRRPLPFVLLPIPLVIFFYVRWRYWSRLAAKPRWSVGLRKIGLGKQIT